jgi:hypothetical protein
LGKCCKNCIVTNQEITGIYACPKCSREVPNVLLWGVFNKKEKDTLVTTLAQQQFHTLQYSQPLNMEGIKQCPNCGINITKDLGCDDMFCIKCRTKFDWRTGEFKPSAINEDIDEWEHQMMKFGLFHPPISQECFETDDKSVNQEIMQEIYKVKTTLAHIDYHLDSAGEIRQEIQLRPNKLALFKINVRKTLTYESQRNYLYSYLETLRCALHSGLNYIDIKDDLKEIHLRFLSLHC